MANKRKKTQARRPSKAELECQEALKRRREWERIEAAFVENPRRPFANQELAFDLDLDLDLSELIPRPNQRHPFL